MSGFKMTPRPEPSRDGRVDFPPRTRIGSSVLFESRRTFGARCRFGSGCCFAAGTEFGDGCRFSYCCTFGPGCVFGADCAFGQQCHFGERAAFGSRAAFGRSCIFGRSCSVGVSAAFGRHCLFDDFADFRDGCTFGKGAHFSSARFRSRCDLGVPWGISPNSTFGPGCRVDGHLALAASNTVRTYTRGHHLEYERVSGIPLSGGGVYVISGHLHGTPPEFLARARRAAGFSSMPLRREEFAAIAELLLISSRSLWAAVLEERRRSREASWRPSGLPIPEAELE
jgi:hypothetical protein